MTTYLTLESSVGLAVQQLLLGEPRGLTVPEIRRRLRWLGKVAEERSLRRLLAQPRIREDLSGDRFALVDGQRSPVRAHRTGRQARPVAEVGSARPTRMQ